MIVLKLLRLLMLQVSKVKLTGLGNLHEDSRPYVGVDNIEPYTAL